MRGPHRASLVTPEHAGPDAKVFPYLGLHMLDSLLQMRGFLIGTTNRIFVERTNPDVILEAANVSKVVNGTSYLASGYRTQCPAIQEALQTERNQCLAGSNR